MRKSILASVAVLFITLFCLENAFALSGDTFINPKDNTLYIEEIMTVSLNIAKETNEYEISGTARALNPNTDSQAVSKATTETDNIVLNIAIEMDFAPKWFLGFKTRHNISTGSAKQEFPGIRTGNLEYDRSELGLYLGHRFLFAPTNPDNLWQLKAYLGAKYAITETTVSELDFPEVTITSSRNAPDNLSDESKSINALLGLSLSRRFKTDNFVEIYAEFLKPLNNETTTSYADSFSEETKEGDAFEAGIKVQWRYTPQSFFEIGLYCGAISFDGGEVQPVVYQKNKKDISSYYQWGENETSYWGISGSYILKF